MPIHRPDNTDYVAIAITLLFCIFGAIAKVSYDILTGKTFTFSALFLQLIVSLFAGSITVLIASHFNWSAEAAGGLAGMAGWTGATLIQTLEARLIKRAKGD